MASERSKPICTWRGRRAGSLALALCFGLGALFVDMERSAADERAPEQAAASVHVHGPGCGHYYVDGTWALFPSAHIHSEHCGHFYYDGAWHWFAKGHVHGPDCGHFFWRGCWHLFPEGHVHGPGCGHLFIDGDWIIPPHFDDSVRSQARVHCTRPPCPLGLDRVPPADPVTSEEGAGKDEAQENAPKLVDGWQQSESAGVAATQDHDQATPQSDGWQERRRYATQPASSARIGTSAVAAQRIEAGGDEAIDEAGGVRVIRRRRVVVTTPTYIHLVAPRYRVIRRTWFDDDCPPVRVPATRLPNPATVIRGIDIAPAGVVRRRIIHRHRHHHRRWCSPPRRRIGR